MWPPPRRAGERESSRATLLAAAVLVGTVRQHFGMQCFLVEQQKYKRAIDCETAVLSIYIADSNFIPPRKSHWKAYFRIRLDHTWRAVPMHDRALPQRGMMVSADLQPYQNGSDGLVSILMGPVGPNHAIFLSS